MPKRHSQCKGNLEFEGLIDIVNLDKLELGIFTPRMGFDEGWIGELAEDIGRYGLHKPIICRPHPVEKGLFQVVDGEHRVRALKRLGLKEVRAEVRGLSDEEAAFLAMRINELHGKHLSDFERGKQMFLLQKKFGWSQEKLAEKFGRSQRWVSDRIALYLSASRELVGSISTRVLTFTHAREIAKLSQEEQPKVVKKVVDEGLSTRETQLLTYVLRKTVPEERNKILSRPVKAIAEMYPQPEVFEEAVKTPMDQPLIESFTCPNCGRKFTIDWGERKVEW